MVAWLHVAAVLFILLYAAAQLPAVLWLAKFFELEDGEQVDPTGGVFEEPDSRPHVPDETYEAVHVPGEDGAPPTSDRARCALCGAENDPDFAYCQNCVAHL